MVALGDFMARFLVAAVLGPFVLLAIYQSDPIWTWGLVFVASLIAMFEFFSMVLENKADRIVSLCIGASASAAFYWISPSTCSTLKSGTEIAMISATILPALYYLFRFSEIESAYRKVGVTIAGIFYGGLIFSILAILRRDFGPGWIMLALIIAWSGDTGAYFAGRFLGKTKLYPSVSPGKTWAGAIGGLIASVGAAALVKLYLMGESDHALAWVDVFALAIPGAILGQMGDLFESLIKRSTGVKDSGGILGAHGGLLDRLDAAMFIGAYVYVYMIIRSF